MSEIPKARGTAMSVREVAAYIDRSEKRVRYLVSKHQIPFTRQGGALVFYSADIDRWLDAITTPAGADAPDTHVPVETPHVPLTIHDLPRRSLRDRELH